MRRSRRYRDKPAFSLDLETRPINLPDGVTLAPFVRRDLVNPAEAQRKAAKKGWRNWYINRGRLPLEGDDRIERQLSWRRVH